MTAVRWLALGLAVVAGGCKQDGPSPRLGPLSAGARVLEFTVSTDGFAPAQLKVKRGEPLVLNVTRTTDQTCATELLIDGTQIHVPLPLNRTVEVRFTPNKSGEIRFGCAMGMMVSGVLLVE